MLDEIVPASSPSEEVARMSELAETRILVPNYASAFQDCDTGCFLDLLESLRYVRGLDIWHSSSEVNR